MAHPGGRPRVENPYKPIVSRVDQRTADVARIRAKIEHTTVTAIVREAIEVGLQSKDAKYPVEAQMGEGYPHELPRSDDSDSDDSSSPKSTRRKVESNSD